MTLYLLRHDTALPAVHGMIAGCVAARLQLELIHLASGGGGLGAFDCAQHVLASGALEPNGLFWAEWAQGPGPVRALGPALQPLAILRRPEPLVVAANPVIAAEAAAAARLADLAQAAGRRLIEITVIEEAGGYRLAAPGTELHGLVWRRDAYGRPVQQAAASVAGPALRLLLIGDPLTQRDTAPAAIAALGDAAEDLGLSLDIQIRDPRVVGPDDLAASISGFHGIVLPGGSDMEQVAGQIRVAEAGLAQNIAVLGLCLGMQSMTTAFARHAAGLPEANMEEAAPEAAVHLFRRLREAEHSGRHRLGEDLMAVRQGSVMAAILGRSGAEPMRCNHRYVLDPAHVPQLEAAGLQIAATQAERDLVDAIAVPDHPFFVGLQGHPEQLSRRGMPYPLFTAFLRAVAAAADPLDP